MLILGIDPGTARLGYGLVEIRNPKSEIPNRIRNGHLSFVAAGCLETTKDMAAGDRLHFLYEEVGKIILKHRPDALAIEQLFFGINSRTAMAVGQARGVVLAVAAKNKVPIFEYQGLSVKFALTGFGRSDKKQMQESVRKHLNMKEIVKPDDAADGLAIAIAHYLKSSGMQDDSEQSRQAKRRR